ncbi:hypothetical protein TNCT_118101 [Trichonephila clavata]|uniref:Uncharacterized protein n=1 Tax=Trichonephila clavata TaxID=2740835 RepID=A0A8X6LXU5_TRICU|nr:hypothetical protein TNCT_118101 [Trichonephila clavata]
MSKPLRRKGADNLKGKLSQSLETWKKKQSRPPLEKDDLCGTMNQSSSPIHPFGMNPFFRERAKQKGLYNDPSRARWRSPSLDAFCLSGFEDLLHYSQARELVFEEDF